MLRSPLRAYLVSGISMLGRPRPGPSADVALIEGIGGVGDLWLQGVHVPVLQDLAGAEGEAFRERRNVIAVHQGLGDRRLVSALVLVGHAAACCRRQTTR